MHFKDCCQARILKNHFSENVQQNLINYVFIVSILIELLIWEIQAQSDIFERITKSVSCKNFHLFYL